MKTVLSIAIASVLASGAMVSTASAEVTGNLGATSNYIWRGVSQTSNQAAVSGGIDYAAESGLYVGTWASNVTDGGEYDLYAGFSKEFGDFSFDVGYIGYFYSDLDDANFGEAYVGLGYSFFSIQASTLANADWDDASFGDDTYVEAAADFVVSEGLALGFHVGSYMYDDSDNDYVDYNVSLTKSFELGDASFMITDTDQDEDDPKFVVSWSTEFSM